MRYFYRDELVRRDMERQGDRMRAMTARIEAMTRTMLRLTIAVLVLTVVNVARVALTLIRS